MQAVSGSKDNKKFGASDWERYIPVPVCEEHPEYYVFYKKAWELAYKHIKDIPGMPQTPYMDEAFCETQIWIWDTCFMSLFCKYAPDVFPGVESLNNFYEVLYGGKHLPTIIPPENEPSWIGAVPGEPYELKIHIADNPPLFAWVEYENALMSGDREHLEKLLYTDKYLQKHYEWFENLTEQKTFEGVFVENRLISTKNGYKWEGGRSGMDNTPRGRIGEHVIGERPQNPNQLWLDAICQQALAAYSISKMFELLGDSENKLLWEERFNQKKNTVNSLYWDETDKFYYDIDCETLDFYKIMTVASFWTLTSGVAPKERAEYLVNQLSNPQTFGGIVPFISLSKSDNDYDAKGGYWRGAVWLPTAYAALRGLTKYSMHKEAHLYGKRLFEHMYKTYCEYTPHTIWECYSPEEYKPSTNETGTGEIVRPDFCGWSALGAISVYIENVLGFHTVNAFENKIEWAKPDTFTGKIGVENLKFGNTVTDIIADGNECTVKSNNPYTLQINGKSYHINAGLNTFSL